jgi:hypothetical protein
VRYYTVHLGTRLPGSLQRFLCILGGKTSTSTVNKLDEVIDKKISKMKDDSLKRAQKAQKDAYLNKEKGARVNAQENERQFQAPMQNGEIV